MKWMRAALISAFVAAVGLQLAGCVGSMQARSVDIKDSPLVSAAILEPGSADQALYRYVNRKVDIGQYGKAIVEPVLIMKDGELSNDELQDYQKLANNAYVYLTQELGKDYAVVQAPEPGTFRVQMAIIDADNSKPVRNTLSSVMPIGIGLSVVKYAATGKQSGVGEITVEMKVTDAASGELLGAALDRRVGGKTPEGIVDTWYNADEGLKYWAKRLAFVLCDMRGGGTNCVKP